MTTYLGKVSYDLYKHATRVRVNIPGTDGIPLSVKAIIGNHSRNLFTKGRAVEVEQAQHDGRLFRVTKVFAALDNSVEITCNFHVRVPNADAFKKDNTMTYGTKNWQGNMSYDRVRFFLSDCYYNSGCKRDAMRAVLNKAFGLSCDHSAQYMASTYGGFYIICRPSQFARFMVYRNEAGQKNGFMDLQVKLFTPEPPKDVYTLLAEKAGITRDQAKRATHALCFSGRSEVEERMGDNACNDEPSEIDVSMNKHISPC